MERDFRLPNIHDYVLIGIIVGLIAFFCFSYMRKVDRSMATYNPNLSTNHQQQVNPQAAAQGRLIQ